MSRVLIPEEQRQASEDQIQANTAKENLLIVKLPESHTALTQTPILNLIDIQKLQLKQRKTQIGLSQKAPIVHLS